MDRNWVVSNDKVAASTLHRLIVELDFPAIYTTNYDRNLEVAFELHGSSGLYEQSGAMQRSASLGSAASF
jgi:hypothetical protein